MKNLIFLVSVFIWSSFFVLSLEASLFSGAYRIQKNDEASGYLLLNYDFDVEKREYSLRYFMELTGSFPRQTVIYKAIANESLTPKSYSLRREREGGFSEVKMRTEGSFWVAEMTDQNGSTEKKMAIMEDIFLSQFVHLKVYGVGEGIHRDLRSKFRYLDEDRFSLKEGRVRALGVERYRGVPTVRLNVSLDGVETIQLWNAKSGDRIKIQDKLREYSVSLVGGIGDAVEGMPFLPDRLSPFFSSLDFSRNAVSRTTEERSHLEVLGL